MGPSLESLSPHPLLCSLAGPGGELRFPALSAAQEDDRNLLSDLHHVESVGVVVDVADFATGEFDDDVSSPKPRFLRRAAFDDPAQEKPFDLGGVVGDGAGEDAHRVPASPLLRPASHFY